MHVGVEESLRDRLPQERVDEAGGKILHIMPGGDQRGAIGDLDAVDPFHRHDLAGRAVPVDGGHAISRHGLHRLGQFGCGGGFAAQVQLPRGPALHVGDDEAGAQAGDLAADLLDMGGRPFIGLDVAVELVDHAGADHLDRDVAPVGGERAMHLRDGSGADRRFVEPAVERLQRPAEALLDLRPDRLERHGRQRILQAQQVRRRFLSNEVGTGRQRLAQLDRGRADRLEGVGIARLRRHPRAETGEPHQPPHRRGRQRIALYAAQRAMPRQRPPPFQEPPDMGDVAGHSRVRSSSRCGSPPARPGSVPPSSP